MRVFSSIEGSKSEWRVRSKVLNFKQTQLTLQTQHSKSNVVFDQQTSYISPTSSFWSSSYTHDPYITLNFSRVETVYLPRVEIYSLQ